MRAYRKFIALWFACAAAGWLFAQVATPFDPVFLASANRYSASSTSTPDLLFWPLNEGSGTDITGDGSLGGDDGTTDAAWVTGWDGSGSALDFNGTDDDAATDAALAFSTNKITLKFQFNPDATNALGCLLESSGNPGAESHVWGLFASTAGTLDGYIQSSGTSQRYEQFLLPPAAAWTNVTVIFDYSIDHGGGVFGDVRVFYGGVEQTMLTMVDNDLGGTGTFSTQILFVGARAGSAYFYNGKLDEIQIWKGDASP